MLAKDGLDEFKLDCQLRRLSERTIKGYYNNSLLFLTFLKNKEGVENLEEIQAIHIKKYIQFLIQTNHKATYINGIIKCIRAFLKYCYTEQLISKNPSEKVVWQREGTVLIETFSNEEVDRMLNAFHFTTYLEARNRLIITLAFDTGIRNSEICNILTNDIRENVILIRGKGNKERVVPISPILKKTMLRFGRLRKAFFENKLLQYENYLLSRTARPLTKEAIEHIFNQANKKAQVRKSIRCSPHTARHYFAQASLRNGLDIYSLSRLLGHSSTNITKIYLQSIQDADIVAMASKSSPLMNL